MWFIPTCSVFIPRFSFGNWTWISRMQGKYLNPGTIHMKLAHNTRSWNKHIFRKQVSKNAFVLDYGGVWVIFPSFMFVYLSQIEETSSVDNAAWLLPLPVKHTMFCLVILCGFSIHYSPQASSTYLRVT